MIVKKYHFLRNKVDHLYTNEIYSIPAKIDLSTIRASSKENISLEFYPSILNSLDEYPHLGIGIKTANNMDLVKVSSLHNYIIID